MTKWYYADPSFYTDRGHLIVSYDKKIGVCLGCDHEEYRDWTVEYIPLTLEILVEYLMGPKSKIIVNNNSITYNELICKIIDDLLKEI